MHVKKPFNWCYPACPRCFRRVNQSTLAQTCNFEACILHGIPVELIPWYRICIEVNDGSARADFVIFGRAAEYIVGDQAINVLETHGNRPYTVPEAIQNIIGNQFTLLVFLKQEETNMTPTEYVVCHVGPALPDFELFSWRNRTWENSRSQQNYYPDDLHIAAESSSLNSSILSASNNIPARDISPVPPFI